MPSSVAFYKSTPVFSETSVPAALQRDHTTAAGVWAKIMVLEGSLEYHITEPAPEQRLLSAGDEGIIAPQMHTLLRYPAR
ncbi:DUF1971 domain-containing protein [Massilia sp. WF1]|uniref:DUF1971 domain-containing protein n=1 Tax=Massilia sp. WF1 TaxID=1406431 RepID=UPI001E47EACC|nr:DUF1971 domain-containing protein [Massilia sp. WF1]